MVAEGDDPPRNGNPVIPTSFDTFKIEDRSSSVSKENGHSMYGYESFDNQRNAPTDGIPWYFGAIIFINALVGAGILNFPYSIHAAGGIYVSIVVQMIMVTLLFCSVTCVIWCSHLRGTTLYQDTVAAYLGPAGKYLCSGTMLVYCFLITTTYVVAIGEQLSAGARILFDTTEHPLASKQFLVIGVSLIVILPFCLVKHIDRLHLASGLASVTVLMVAIVVVYEYHRIDTSEVHVVTSPTKWTNVFLSIPAYAIAYMFDLASVAVYGRMRPRTVGSFMKAGSIALVSVFCFYNVFAGYAYYSFGDKIKPNFMANYVEGTWVIAFAQFAYSLKLCLEYPIYQFLGWTALRTLVNALGGSYCALYLNEERNPENVDRFRLMTSLLWIFSTMSVAFFAPDISYVLPLASAAVLHFQFSFPGLCILSAVRAVGDSIKPKYAIALRAFAVFIIAFGIGMSIILVYQTANGDSARASSSPSSSSS